MTLMTITTSFHAHTCVESKHCKEDLWYSTIYHSTASTTLPMSILGQFHCWWSALLHYQEQCNIPGKAPLNWWQNSFRDPQHNSTVGTFKTNRYNRRKVLSAGSFLLSRSKGTWSDILWLCLIHRIAVWVTVLHYNWVSICHWNWSDAVTSYCAYCGSSVLLCL